MGNCLVSWVGNLTTARPNRELHQTGRFSSCALLVDAEREDARSLCLLSQEELATLEPLIGKQLRITVETYEPPGCYVIETVTQLRTEWERSAEALPLLLRVLEDAHKHGATQPETLRAIRLYRDRGYGL